MKLPNVEEAVVDRRKIVEYLLNESHPVGKHKAAYFRRFGFRAVAWTVFADALRLHAAVHEIAGTLETAEGVHYVVEGRLSTPDGRNPQVRSVWMVDVGSTRPRFITAYPLA